MRGLAHADGIFLLANDISDTRQMTEALVCEASKVELRVITSKTEIIRSRIEDNSEVETEDNGLQEDEKLVYLGCELRKVADTRNEVRTVSNDR